MFLLAGVGLWRIYEPTGQCVKMVSFEAAPAWRVWFWFGGETEKARRGRSKKVRRTREAARGNGNTFVFWRWIMISISKMFVMARGAYGSAN